MPELDAARAAYQRGEFRVALLRLEEAERSPRLTEEDVVRIHWYRGASFHAQGRTQDAEKSFDALLRLRPLYAPDKVEAPPDLRATFHARAELYQQKHGIMFGAPSLEGRVMVVPLSGNVSEAASVAAFVRAAGEVSFREQLLGISGPSARGSLDHLGFWELVRDAGRIELVLEARNSRGVPISRRGDAVRPIVLEVSAADAAAAASAVAPVVPPVQPPATAQGSGQEARTVVAEEPAQGSALATPLLASGAVLLAGGMVAGVLAVATVVLAGAAWGGHLWSIEQITVRDRDRSWLEPIFYATYYSGLSLPVLAAVLVLVALGAVGGGAAAFIARVLL